MGDNLEDKNISSDNDLKNESNSSASQDLKPWRHRKHNKKKRLSLRLKMILVLIILAVCAGVGASIYFLQKPKTTENSNSNKVNTTTANKAKDEVLAKIPEQQKNNIQGAIVFKNYSFLEQYMADSVKIVGVEPKLSKTDSPTQVADDLKYLDGSTNQWSFDLKEDSIKSFKQGDYASYFKSNTLVGKSTNNYHAIFNFDSSGKINSILMSTTSNGMTK